jgi:hypothetical protein
MTDTKLFTVQTKNDIFFTGLSESGLQMLVAQGFNDEFVVIYFDDDGACLRWEDYPDLKMKYNNGPYNRAYDIAYNAKVQTIVRELGLVSQQPIRVQRFFITKHLIGIRQYPNSLQRFLPQIEYSSEEVEALRELHNTLTSTGYQYKFSCFLAEEHLQGYSAEEDEKDAALFRVWTVVGNYVLYFGNDFWSNPDGFIIVT